MKHLILPIVVCFAVCAATVCVFAQDWGEIAGQEGFRAPFQKRTATQLTTDYVQDTVPKAYRNYPRLVVKDAVAREHGLQVLRGKRLVLVTDVPITPAVERLPAVADAAFPHICEFFGRDPGESWNITLFLMKDRLPFIQAGYLPDILPNFLNGFSFNYDCWVCEQPSDYYREHLVIHEMVHSFSNTVLGNVGPGWYAEALAEFLGMHRVLDETGAVALGIMPPNRESVPYCGRVREILTAVKRGEARPFRELFRSRNADYQSNEIYFWGWSLAWFCENHPDVGGKFRGLTGLFEQNLPDDAFEREFLDALGDDLQKIDKHWMMLVATFDYGYDLAPMLFDTTRGEPLPAEGRKVLKIRADRGWQNSALHFRAGDKIRIRAKGRFEIAQGDGVWYPCEPNGITIRYFKGQPLGVLQACFLTDADVITAGMMNDTSPGTFYNPIRVGLSQTFEVPADGTLLLRLNGPSTHLSDSRGTVAVEVATARTQGE